MVMHMILAYSAGELRRKTKRQRWDGTIITTSCSSTTTATGMGVGMDGLEATELYHYTAALRELQELIKTTSDDDDGNGRIEAAWTRFEANLDALLSAIFIMIYYGLQSMSSLGHARTHVAGLGSLVATYVRARNKRRTQKASPENEREGHGFSALSSLLLLWILYVDMNQLIALGLSFFSI